MNYDGYGTSLDQARLMRIEGLTVHFSPQLKRGNMDFTSTPAPGIHLLCGGDLSWQQSSRPFFFTSLQNNTAFDLRTIQACTATRRDKMPSPASDAQAMPSNDPAVCDTLLQIAVMISRRRHGPASIALLRARILEKRREIDMVFTRIVQQLLTFAFPSATSYLRNSVHVRHHRSANNDSLNVEFGDYNEDGYMDSWFGTDQESEEESEESEESEDDEEDEEEIERQAAELMVLTLSLRGGESSTDRPWRQIHRAGDSA
ncbi:hypothetical protein GE09DRAFT_668617 [Coniochaeta sp. 2T2.1]|nr:hypothetical protein GE09DRAFT_668617 [Coniochaeta sp. 2T2.1]